MGLCEGFPEGAASIFYPTLWFVIIVAACQFVYQLVDLFQIHLIDNVFIVPLSYYLNLKN